MKTRLSHKDILSAARVLATKIPSSLIRHGEPTRIYGVPRGGVPVAYALVDNIHAEIMDHPSLADIIVDDLIDSGATMARYPGKPFFALYSKREGKDEAIVAKIMPKTHWIIFPWEESEEKSAEDICTRLLQYIGEDPDREGLKETPKRMLKAWKHWTKGYKENAADVMKVFEDGAENCDEMVVVKDIPVWSHCEHHMCPIFGTATVAYIPDGKIIGLSKIIRLVDIYARRLQVQERLGNQVVDAIQTHLAPLGCGIVMRLRHLCIESRGAEKMGSETITCALRGVFKTQAETRAEFLALGRS